MAYYCLYLRKSRADLEAEARGEGETLARHEHILLELAGKMKLNVTKSYKEIVSGETISARPVMQQLLTDVEKGIWDGVLVVEVERLARGDTIDQGIVAQTFKYSNTKIITPMKTYDPNDEYDEEYFEFGLFMSRREYKTINRRLQAGRIQSVKEGKYVGNKPPYGYARKKIEHDKGYTLEPNPGQADIVRMIYELYTEGEIQPDGRRKRLGTSLISQKLNSLHIPPMNGGVWVPSSIRTILKNPVYIGKVRWNYRPAVKKMIGGKVKKKRPRAKPEEWIIADGLHEPIIDIETWNIAQESLTTNHPKPTNRKIKNPLAGLIICGMCGRRMIRKSYGGRAYPDSLMCPNAECANVSSKLCIVEEHLLDALDEWLQKYKLTWDIQNEPAHDSMQVDVAKKALAKLDVETKMLEKQRDNIHNLLEQGVYSTNTFFERSRTIAAKMEETQKSLKTVKKELQTEQARETSKKEIIPKVEKVLELFRMADDPELKNQLLKEVLEKVVYTKTVNSRWHGSPGDFELILYPKLPK